MKVDPSVHSLAEVFEQYAPYWIHANVGVCGGGVESANGAAAEPAITYLGRFRAGFDGLSSISTYEPEAAFGRFSTSSSSCLNDLWVRPRHHVSMSQESRNVTTIAMADRRCSMTM